MFACLMAGNCFLSATPIRVRHIPQTGQLPASVINTVLQDSEGYIWYGTEDGLCRDDGYDIHTFRSDYHNPNLLASNVVTCLAEDSTAHDLWVGTEKGLYKLDKKNYALSPMVPDLLREEHISHILVASDGNIWVSAYRKLYLLSPLGKVVKEYPLECVAGAGNEFFLYENRQHELLLSISGKGMHRWNRQSGKFELFYPYVSRINGMIQDKEGDFYWLASWHFGVIRFDPSAPTKEEQWICQPMPFNSTGLKATTAIQIVQDDKFGYIWTTSWTDLFAYRITKGGRELEQVDTSGFLPRQNKVLTSIMKDSEGNLWVTGTDNHNFILDFTENELSVYNVKPLLEKSKWTPVIEQLCRDEEGVFWLFQSRLGLTLYHPDRQETKRYTDAASTSHLPFLVLSRLLKSHRKGLVWVMPDSGLAIYGLRQKGMEIEQEYKIDLTDIVQTPYEATLLLEDRTGDLWVATGNALYVCHADGRKAGPVSGVGGAIGKMVQADDGTLWGIGRENGLIKVRTTGEPEIYPLSQRFSSLAVSKDLLWLGSDKGELYCFSPQTKRLESYHEKYNMGGDKINNLLADDSGRIWITTNREVKMFNPQDGTYRSFPASDPEIGFSRFLPDAICKAPDGRLYIGGIAGILSISPTRHIESPLKHGVPVITDVRIMGQSLLLEDGHTKNSSGAVEIRPDEQNLEICFSTLDHSAARQVRYAYRLSGVDKEWMQLPTGRNSAFYNKLGKGHYVFQVKAADRNGLWSDKLAEIHIHRLPAWYETWWAYLLYIGIVLGLVCYFYLQLRHRLRLQAELQIEKLEKAKVEEVNHAKLQFFTNITHELLTPLTILSASVEELCQMAPDYKSQYRVMTNNINRLIRLLQQILEFRKAETGNLKLRVSEADLALFVRRSVEAFLPLAAKKKIHFEVDCRPEPFMAYFDPDKLDKILYNLLSNAAKYSRPDEVVRVKLSVHPGKEGYARLVVKDNGPGISREAQKGLFQRFYEGKHRQFHTIGTGIGLSLVSDLAKLHHGSVEVESEEGHGAAFIVCFPVGMQEYAPQEIDSETPQDAQSPFLYATDVPLDTADEEAGEPSGQLKEKKHTLLLVEDNEELLRLMEKLLSVEYNLCTATNGREAWEMLNDGAQRVDLIVSDVMMPVMDGIELCRRVKGNFETCHIPLLLLTAKRQEEDRIEAYQSGADSFVSKPFSLSLLHARIENLLLARERQTQDFKKQIVFDAKEADYTSMDKEFLQKAIECVNRHLDDTEFGQEQFVDELHTSKSTSLRKLKSLTGLNFVSFVRNIRMKAACRLLEEDDRIRISEVAYAVGYNDPHYFTRTFKKEFDITPQEYVARFRAEKSFPESAPDGDPNRAS